MQLSSRIVDVLEHLDQTRGLFYSLSKPEAELLAVFARMMRAKKIVEVGTGNGYSAIVLGAVAKKYGGSVTTIERNGRLVEVARKNIADAGLQDVVTVCPGSAYKELKKISGPIDLVFLDATKQEYIGYYERIREKLNDDALLVADNVISHEEDLHAFIRMVKEDPDCTATILPIGNGLLVGIFGKESPIEDVNEKHFTSLNELVTKAAPRIFKGTVSQVRSGQIFSETPEKIDTNFVPDEFDGYVNSLFEESLKMSQD